MSCNGCRVLRKGCREDCMLRHCLQWIENPQAQAHATLFVAKFFGRATLMSFLSSVPTYQRSALFRSLVYEAVGRTINPVNGAVGLLWTGNWQLCQLGVEKVLRGGALSPLPQYFFDGFDSADLDCSTATHQYRRSRFDESFQAGSLERVVVDSGRYHQDQSETTPLASSAGDSASPRKLLRLFF